MHWLVCIDGCSVLSCGDFPWSERSDSRTFGDSTEFIASAYGSGTLGWHCGKTIDLDEKESQHFLGFLYLAAGIDRSR